MTPTWSMGRLPLLDDDDGDDGDDDDDDDDPNLVHGKASVAC